MMLDLFTASFAAVHSIILYFLDMYKCTFSPSFVDCSGWKVLADEWFSASNAIAGKNLGYCFLALHRTWNCFFSFFYFFLIL